MWETLKHHHWQHQAYFALALVIAFAFEFINGFHDTANAVTTVIYTKTLRATPAVLFSGFCNFLGVLLGGTAVAFSIVNLLPVDLLIDSTSTRAIVMVVSLLLAGVIWNLATWWYGLPVSSSHTLIGSILGVGLANSLMTRGNVSGVNWSKAGEIGLSLLISPVIGFVSAAGLLLLMKRFLREPNLYHPPGEGDNPPHWVRGVLLATCGGVSFAHGSNDGQKGMGLILLTLIGFLPTYYALDLRHHAVADHVREAAHAIDHALDAEPAEKTATLRRELATVLDYLGDKPELSQVAPDDRWQARQAIFRFRNHLQQAQLSPVTRKSITPHVAMLSQAIEYVPFWVVIGVALALGIGTTVGYKRIVVTVAEKIGKTHLTYAQGAAAEIVAAFTITLADLGHLPVSTTQVLSSGVAGTMWANRSGVQPDTLRRIGLAWLMTLPASIFLSAGLFVAGGALLPPTLSNAPTTMPKPVAPATELTAQSHSAPMPAAH
ncbi:MAG: inorganic phosphate transporter [Planctomycetes bacterium]|nr:inorganic phosphate transporter [Planctomycetota bacterium]